MNQEKKILFLSLEELLECGAADVKLAAQDVQKGFELLYNKKINQPPKLTLKGRTDIHEHSTGLINFLPAYINMGEEDIFGCKQLGAMPSNVNLGLPRATGLITLFDAITKIPLCIMGAQVISATRTGAVSLLAAKKLADHDTEEIGLVGAGVNMRTQLLGLKEALTCLKRVKVYSRGESKHIFAREMGERTGLEIKAVDTAEEAIKGSSLIVSCLPNVNQPVVKEKWVKEKGVTAINIGCYEMETTILRRMDRIVADIWEHGKHRGVQTHAMAVSQDIIDENKIEDLAPILAGKKPGRISKDENIFFCPTGLGFEDIIVAWRVYKEACRLNKGSWLTLWKSTKWI